MPLDPNIILQAGQGVTPFDPFGTAQKVMQLKQAQMQMQGQQRLRDLAAANDVTTPEGQQAFLSGYGKFDPLGAMKAQGEAAVTGQKIALGQQESQKAALEAQKLKLDKAQAFAQSQAGVLMAGKQALQQVPPGSPQEQQVFQQINDGLTEGAKQAGFFDPEHPASQQQISNRGQLDFSLAKTMGLHNQMEQQKTQTEQQLKAAELAEQQRAHDQSFKSSMFGHQVTMRGQNMTDARARETNQTLKAATLNGLKGDELMAGIGTQDPNLAAEVRQAINGDLDTTSRNMKNGELVAALASRVDPNFDQHAYKLKQTALADKEVTAANAALSHIGDFKAALAKLDPQTQALVLNKPLNWIREHATDNPVLAELATTGLSLSEEYGKALGAGQNVAGDLKREAVFDPSKPIGALTANLGAVGNLLNRTINAKENALLRNRPGGKSLSLMDPGAVDVLKSLGVSYSPGGKKSAPADSGKQLPASVKAKVDAARAAGHSESDIADALKKMGY